MPFYEYECSDCGQYVEALQKISDPPLRECPKCKHEALTRLMSAPAFRLKGGGWYETDFKSGSDTKRNLAEGGGASDSGSSDSSKPAEAPKTEAKKEPSAESKPAAKPVETKATTTTV
jgi:putative FmdB family regulatory protein